MHSHQKQLITLLETLPGTALCGAEIGVNRGETSDVLLKAFPGLFLYLVDSWATYPKDHPYRQSGDRCARRKLPEQDQLAESVARQTEPYRHRRHILRMDSLEAAERIPDGALDFVFIDADHTYEAVRADLQAWFPKVRPGGLFSGHDYNSLRERRGQWGVKRAVDEFAARHERDVSVGRGRVWWMTIPPVMSTTEVGLSLG